MLEQYLVDPKNPIGTVISYGRYKNSNSKGEFGIFMTNEPSFLTIYDFLDIDIECSEDIIISSAEKYCQLSNLKSEHEKFYALNTNDNFDIENIIESNNIDLIVVDESSSIDRCKKMIITALDYYLQRYDNTLDQDYNDYIKNPTLIEDDIDFTINNQRNYKDIAQEHLARFIKQNYISPIIRLTSRKDYEKRAIKISELKKFFIGSEKGLKTNIENFIKDTKKMPETFFDDICQSAYSDFLASIAKNDFEEAATYRDIISTLKSNSSIIQS